MAARRRRAARTAPRLRGVSLLVPVLAVLLLSCRPGPWDPLNLGRTLVPFDRLPYVQSSDTASAWILWRASAAVRDSFRYRIEGTEEWSSAAVERRPVPEGRGRIGPAPAAPLEDRRVRLERLPPGSWVHYQVFADTIGVGPDSFRTAPRPGQAGEVRVLAFGDSGWGSQAQLKLASLMEADRWDLVVHTGDLAYERGSQHAFTVRHFHIYARLLASVPFFPSPGNHDLETDGGEPYDRAFLWPKAAPDARYYTFRWGDIRFFALDTASPRARDALGDREGPQYQWLVEQLRSAASEPGLRWTVVYMHHPVHSHGMGFAAKGSDGGLQASLIPLFEAYGVDLVVAGHDHHYERTHPLQGRRAVRPGCGPVYLVTGGGGATTFARDIAPTPLLAHGSREHHYLELRFAPSFVRGRAVNVDGRELDSFLVDPYPGMAGGEPERCD